MFQNNQSGRRFQRVYDKVWMYGGSSGHYTLEPRFEEIFDSYEWSSLVEELILNQSAVKGSWGTGYTFPVAPGLVVDLGVAGEVQLFECTDRNTNELRSFLQAKVSVTVGMAVGAGIGVKKYPVPKGRNRNKKDPATGKNWLFVKSCEAS